MRLLGEVGHRDHQNPEGKQNSESEWCSDQHASVHFVPSHCYAPLTCGKGLVRFESVTITADGNARMSTGRREPYPRLRIATSDEQARLQGPRWPREGWRG